MYANYHGNLEKTEEILSNYRGNLEETGAILPKFT